MPCLRKSLDRYQPKGGTLESHPIYHPQYEGSAVVVFSSRNDDHAVGFESACALQEEHSHKPGQGSVTFVTMAEWDTWGARKPGWAKKLLRDTAASGRLKADEMARRSGQVAQFAQEAASAKAARAQLEAEMQAAQAKHRETEEQVRWSEAG